MIATSRFFHIQPSSYCPASAPVTHAGLVSVETINFFVGFTKATDRRKLAGDTVVRLCPPSDFITKRPDLHRHSLDLAGRTTLTMTMPSSAMQICPLPPQSPDPLPQPQSTIPSNLPGDFEDTSVILIFDYESES
jgi:hypothetical protein